MKVLDRSQCLALVFAALELWILLLSVNFHFVFDVRHLNKTHGLSVSYETCKGISDKINGVMYRVCHLIFNPKKLLSGTTNQKPHNSCVIHSVNLPSNIGMKVNLVARPLLKQVAQKLLKYEHGVFTCKKCVHFPNIT